MKRKFHSFCLEEIFMLLSFLEIKGESMLEEDILRLFLIINQKPLRNLWYDNGDQTFNFY